MASRLSNVRVTSRLRVPAWALFSVFSVCAVIRSSVPGSGREVCVMVCVLWRCLSFIRFVVFSSFTFFFYHGLPVSRVNNRTPPAPAQRHRGHTQTHRFSQLAVFYTPLLGVMLGVAERGPAN